MIKTPQIIVPVENGFAVIPYDMNTAVAVQKMASMPMHVARDVSQLQEVVGKIYGDDDNNPPKGESK